MNPKSTQHEEATSTVQDPGAAPRARRPKSRILSSSVVVRAGLKAGAGGGRPAAVLVVIDEG